VLPLTQGSPVFIAVNEIGHNAVGARVEIGIGAPTVPAMAGQAGRGGESIRADEDVGSPDVGGNLGGLVEEDRIQVVDVPVKDQDRHRLELLNT
jgi:hypothetical protein